MKVLEPSNFVPILLLWFYGSWHVLQFIFWGHLLLCHLWPKPAQVYFLNQSPWHVRFSEFKRVRRVQIHRWKHDNDHEYCPQIQYRSHEKAMPCQQFLTNQKPSFSWINQSEIQKNWQDIVSEGKSVTGMVDWLQRSGGPPQLGSLLQWATSSVCLFDILGKHHPGCGQHEQRTCWGRK